MVVLGEFALRVDGAAKFAAPEFFFMPGIFFLFSSPTPHIIGGDLLAGFADTWIEFYSLHREMLLPLRPLYRLPSWCPLLLVFNKYRASTNVVSILHSHFYSHL